jgi:hypothetical protein
VHPIIFITIKSYQPYQSAVSFFSGNSPGFGSPWYASMQLIIPVAKDNTFGISFFRPYHTQSDLLTGSNYPGITTNQASEGSYLLNPTFQESIIELSYAARLPAVRNFSVGINIKRVTNDP